MQIKNICCIGAGYVGGPTMAVIALKTKTKFDDLIISNKTVIYIAQLIPFTLIYKSVENKYTDDNGPIIKNARAVIEDAFQSDKYFLITLMLIA